MQMVAQCYNDDTIQQRKNAQKVNAKNTRKIRVWIRAVRVEIMTRQREEKYMEKIVDEQEKSTEKRVIVCHFSFIRFHCHFMLFAFFVIRWRAFECTETREEEREREWEEKETAMNEKSWKMIEKKLPFERKKTQRKIWRKRCSRNVIEWQHTVTADDFSGCGTSVDRSKCKSFFVVSTTGKKIELTISDQQTLLSQRFYWINRSDTNEFPLCMCECVSVLPLTTNLKELKRWRTEQWNKCAFRVMQWHIRNDFSPSVVRNTPKIKQKNRKMRKNDENRFSKQKFNGKINNRWIFRFTFFSVSFGEHLKMYKYFHSLNRCLQSPSSE